MIFIYALYDPMEPTVFRYVGLSKNPDNRLLEHLEDATDLTYITHKCCWIRKIASEGRTPSLIILHTVETHEEACMWERSFIAAAIERGHRLTNGTDGGDGVVNPSIETRIKHLASMGTPEVAAKRRATVAKQMENPKFIKNLHEALSKSRQNPDNQERTRAKLTARWTNPDTRAKHVVATQQQMQDPEKKARHKAALNAPGVQARRHETKRQRRIERLRAELALAIAEMETLNG